MSVFNIPTITTDSNHQSVFSTTSYEQEQRGGMLLSRRIEARNFRLRLSEPGYETAWHLAGDPTLIIVQNGTLRIELRDGSFREFSSGEQFIAADNLPADIPFDEEKHGHRAQVLGTETLRAVHIKLGSPLNG